MVGMTNPYRTSTYCIRPPSQCLTLPLRVCLSRAGLPANGGEGRPWVRDNAPILGSPGAVRQADRSRQINGS
jgi:hypothetical protein